MNSEMDNKPTSRQQDAAERLVRQWLNEQADPAGARAIIDSARQASASPAGRLWRLRLAGLAAAAAVLIAAGVWWMAHRPAGVTPTTATAIVLGDGSERTAAAAGPVALADGSRMTLSAGTRYRLARRAAGSAAVQVISGRASFDVAKSDLPFVVRTPNCDVRAVGTSFMVDASVFDRRPGQRESIFATASDAVVVAVFEGAVQVSNPQGRLDVAGGAVALAEAKSAPTLLEKDQGPGVGVTIYDSFATVKERRVLDLAAGESVTQFTGVAKTIDPTSVHFVSLSDPAGVQVLEQNYEYDLVDAAKVIEKFIDRSITVALAGGGADGATEVAGVLKSADAEALTLEVEGATRIVSAADIRDLRLGALPEGLVTRPTLRWRTHSERAGKHLVKMSYMADALSWRANYIATLNGDDTKLDLAAWVTVSNESGARYENAQLKLIAGDVRRIVPYVPVPELAAAEKLKEDKANGAQGFVEKSFGEYHMYTLPRPTTINDNQVKQIEMFEPVAAVPVTRFYEYPAGPGADKVNVKVEFKNEKRIGLGMPLPKGTVRMFKSDPADGSLEFIGEDDIDHTPRDERLELYIGDAFDIAAETKQTKASSGQRWARNSYQAELRNHKDADIEVRVLVRVPANFTVEAETVDGAAATHTAKDAFTLEYRVPVKADGKATLAWTIYQTW
ncbi:MAG: hypothetical protein BIFFINMI_04110 [Phycisphaerae bacterium]|nr:hypothetical protein [Phycisphaerae bacterium]